MKKNKDIPEDEAKAVIAVLRYFFDEENLTYDKIAARIGFTYTDNAKFSKLIRHTEKTWSSWNEADFNRAKDYIDKRNLWTSRNYTREIINTPDYLYHALIAFYNVKYGTEQDTIRLTEGLWRVYRPSVSVPEKYVVGMAKIEFNDSNKSLQVYECYRGKGDDDDSDKKIKMRSRYSELEGFLCRKKQKCFIISRDKAVTAAQMTYLPHPSREPQPDGEGDAVATMSGTVIGVYANHVFTSRIYYERFDGSEQELRDMLDLYEKKDIPDIVCAELDNRQRSRDVPFDLF